MSIITLGPRDGVLARLNPVAKLAATLVVTGVLLVSIDPVSAGTTLAVTLLLLPFARIPVRELWLRMWPIAVGAVIAAAATTLYGRPSGELYVQWGVLRISDGSIELALAILLRVLAIALPSVLLFATTDPTDLADGLAQLLRLPARFVIGGLAGLRLVGLLIEDWRELSLARRARGIADEGRLRRLAGQTFALLVLAIRRGSKLATAMEARGFGSDIPRTWARVSRLHARDAMLLVIALAVATASVWISVAVGAWRPIFGL
jgi:energy-coupling factor transport system permease protein